MRQKPFGEEHSNALSSMGNLANTYRNQEMWNEAEQLKVQDLKMRKKLLCEECWNREKGINM